MTRFWYLHVLARQTCPAVVTVNGFPVFNGALPRETAVPAIINEFLVQGVNELALEVKAAGLDVPKPLRPGSTVPVVADIRIFAQGEVVTPDDGQSVLLLADGAQQSDGPVRSIEADLTVPAPGVPVAARAWRFTVQDGPDFSQLLHGPTRPVPEDALIDYGCTLVELFRTQQVTEFLKEYAPRARAQATALGRDLNQVAGQIRELAQQAIGLGLARVPTREQIRARPWCGGRVHELYVVSDADGEGPLLVTNEDGEGAFRLPIFVAPVGQDGALKVVR